MRILAISGSLRAASSNSAIVRAAALLAPDGVNVEIYDGLGSRPHFNPDLDTEVPLPPVGDFRSRLTASHAVLISCPEYAHGVPGVMKNALDWLVGSGELSRKPIALINASPIATLAQASLRETLTVMEGIIVPEASIALPVQGKHLDAEAIAAHQEFSKSLRASLVALLKAVTGHETAR
ncbi:MAG: NAD(P)H-dependent oxidoreductase [Acidobacteria bacterium]|nr:NAD(P)H-dependent oxidoreductase [Acidobacteriota bacterium]